jgi:hypothetical protein
MKPLFLARNVKNGVGGFSGWPWRFAASLNPEKKKRALHTLSRLHDNIVTLSNITTCEAVASQNNAPFKYIYKYQIRI